MIDMFPEEASDEVFRIAKNIPKIENARAGIDRLVMLFYGKTYKSGKQLFMRDQYSKDDTYSFMKVATNVMCTQMYSKSRINKFG